MQRYQIPVEISPEVERPRIQDPKKSVKNRLENNLKDKLENVTAEGLVRMSLKIIPEVHQ